MTPSMQAVWITRIVISWIAWDLTGSSTYVGLLSFFLFVPYITTIPFFGVLLDRIEPLKTAILAQLIQGLAAFSIFLLHVFGVLSIFNLCIISLIIGTANSAQGSARQTIVPRIVDKPTIANAVAFNAMNFQVARIIGPSIGGILIGLVGTQYTILISSFFFIPALVTLSLIKLAPKQSEPKTKETNFIGELIDGAKFAYKNVIILECIILTFIASIIIRGCHELLPALADGKFNMGAEGLGNIMAAAGVGALISAFLIASRKKTYNENGIPIIAKISLLIGLLSVTILGQADTWNMALFAAFISGACVTNVAIDMQSTVQMQLTDSYRARVASLWLATAIGGNAVGSILNGIFSDIYGISNTFFCVGIIGITLVIFTQTALIMNNKSYKI
jgi:MFS family permease